LKRSFVLTILLSSPLLSQTPPPTADLKPDTVIATIDGRKLTYGEIDKFLDPLGPQRKAQALADPTGLIKQYAFQLKLVELAEKDKLDQASPYKEALEVQRRNILSEAEFDYKAQHTLITPEFQKKTYEDHKDRYTEVKLQVIYLGFTSDEVAKENPKKYRNEAQAKALALKLRAEAKTGADFVRLAKQYSEDETSKAKDGEYGTVKKSDNTPAEIQNVVFALKQDEISEPVKQQNGFYLFRAQSVGLRPYEEVKDEIYIQLRDAAMNQWIAGLQKNIVITLDNPTFFKSKQ